MRAKSILLRFRDSRLEAQQLDRIRTERTSFERRRILTKHIVQGGGTRVLGPIDLGKEGWSEPIILGE